MVELAPVTDLSTLEGRSLVRLYEEVFEEHDREPVRVLAVRLERGVYRFTGAFDSSELVGFYGLDVRPDPGYVLLTYLGVHPRFQGRGVGSTLFSHALATFHRATGLDWFLVEAEDRPARLYGKLGAWTFEVPYAAPHFTDPDSTPMHLMGFREGPRPATVTGRWLSEIVRHIYVEGYRLPPDDSRVERLLRSIPDPVRLLDGTS